ncbi:MAG: hypothetical protein ACYC6R_15195 [Anaerolineales bacterium]
MSNNLINLSWVVVEVRSGIPISAKAFSEYELAEEYSEKLRKNMNLENDETGIFPINLEKVKN